MTLLGVYLWLAIVSAREHPAWQGVRHGQDDRSRIMSRAEVLVSLACSNLDP